MIVPFIREKVQTARCWMTLQSKKCGMQIPVWVVFILHCNLQNNPEKVWCQTVRQAPDPDQTATFPRRYLRKTRYDCVNSEVSTTFLGLRVIVGMEIAYCNVEGQFYLFGGYQMKHPVDVHVGKRIRHRRWMVGMTQQQLADSVGIKFQQIQKYETGMNRVSASRLWDIAHTLNVPISFFFEGIGGDEGSAASGQEDILSNKEAMELVRAYYSIPEEQRRRLFDLARVLSDAA
jgi:transcriptional regulator with XRE-family HTH domain